MPFCTQCGTEVQPSDVFCAACGARQGGSARSGPQSPLDPPPGAAKHADEFLKNVTSRNASLLCYIPVVGWVASIVVLASHRFREQPLVRFHAFQGLYLFVLWLFVDWVFDPIASYAEPTRMIGKIMKAVVFAAWIFMLVKTGQGEDFHLPVIGELADRSVSEQR